jgi:hypothetical protein
MTIWEFTGFTQLTSSTHNTESPPGKQEWKTSDSGVFSAANPAENTASLNLLPASSGNAAVVIHSPTSKQPPALQHIRNQNRL